MKAGQETILAMILGFSLGFVVAAGIFLLPSLYKPPKKTDVTSLIGNGKQTVTPVQSQFTVSEPKDYAGVMDENVTVSGKSNPGEYIVFSTLSADQVVQTTAQGDFHATVTVPEGASDIWITRYKDDSAETVDRKIFRVDREKNQ